MLPEGAVEQAPNWAHQPKPLLTYLMDKPEKKPWESDLAPDEDDPNVQPDESLEEGDEPTPQDKDESTPDTPDEDQESVSEEEGDKPTPQDIEELKKLQKRVDDKEEYIKELRSKSDKVSNEHQRELKQLWSDLVENNESKLADLYEKDPKLADEISREKYNADADTVLDAIFAKREKQGELPEGERVKHQEEAMKRKWAKWNSEREAELEQKIRSEQISRRWNEWIDKNEDYLHANRELMNAVKDVKDTFSELKSEAQTPERLEKMLKMATDQYLANKKTDRIQKDAVDGEISRRLGSLKTGGDDIADAPDTDEVLERMSQLPPHFRIRKGNK